MNVAFVAYESFRSNSGVHIFHLANELSALGYHCVVSVPHGVDTASELGVPRFQTVAFGTKQAGDLAFPNGRPADLVHAWTPRERVRRETESLTRVHGCPYVVHLEDNEDVVTSTFTGIPLEQLRTTSDAVLAGFGDSLAHPRRWRTFLEGAAGMTVIIETLLEFRPEDLPAEVLWPAYEQDLFVPSLPDPKLRKELRIRADDCVVVYHGNVHAANAREMRSLYLAVGLLQRQGRRVRLIRLGVDHVDLVGDLGTLANSWVTTLGYVRRAELPRYLALADVLVQPGSPGPFNDYRFPSKLPEFLAMEKPVILPRSNIGHHLTEGSDCLLLDEGNSIEIAEAVTRVMDNRNLAEELGRGARRFAEAQLNWTTSASKLSAFYERLKVDAGAEPVDDVSSRYSAYAASRLGYATVRDYCDSVESLPELATTSKDMKDVQRPWIVKTVVASVPRGARLLEIGAGEPLVANLLGDHGYDVTVIDPYDGRDGGPADVERICGAYPRVRLIQGVFPDAVPEGEKFDCVYSISVLEHIPTDGIDVLCDGMRSMCRGTTIHAIDHVLLGNGSDAHLTRLRRLTSSLGIREQELEDLLRRLELDPDTYFLSAAAHNRWRAATPYDEFPMRRCVSVHICVPL